MKRFQILSLSGGGIRGAFVTSYLNQLEQKLGRPIAECFDLIAGTSTGSIIAAGLASGTTAEEMHSFYVRYGAAIFTPRKSYLPKKRIIRMFYPLVNWVFQKQTGTSMDAAFRSRFCPNVLKESFDEVYGDRTLGSVGTTRLIVPTMNLTDGTPHVFRSCHLPIGVTDKDVKISDAVIASTAAPTFFPHRQIGDSAYIDGGMWASDPSMLAVAEAMQIQHLSPEHKQGEASNTDELALLSIGTGSAQFSMSPPGADAGILYWAARVPDVMLTAQSQGIHLPLKFFLGERYSHINFKMTEKWGLDDVQFIPQLFKVGEQRARETFDRINDQFLQHRREPFVPCTNAEGAITLDEFGFE